jgi:hypothetical protein
VCPDNDKVRVHRATSAWAPPPSGATGRTPSSPDTPGRTAGQDHYHRPSGAKRGAGPGAKAEALALAPHRLFGQVGGWLKSAGSTIVGGIQRGASIATTALFGQGRSDLKNDGRRIPINIRGASSTGPDDRVIYVNGALSNLAQAKSDATLLGKAANRNVLLIDSATSIRQYSNPIAKGLALIGDSRGDEARMTADYAGAGDPAITATRDEILHRLDEGLPVELAGYSRGAQIIARALHDVRDTRVAELTPSLGANRAEAKVASEFARIKVLNISGAARRADFPAGIDYRHVELPGDPVVAALGEGSGRSRDQNYAQAISLLGPQLILSFPEHLESNVLAVRGAEVARFLGEG